MRINLERTVETVVSLDILRKRLAQWAELTKYSCIHSGPAYWEFQRGSWWHSLYAFDIRKWPSKATVATQGQNPMQVSCSLRFKCWWTVPTTEDEQSLLNDFEMLLAFVCETRPSHWRMDPDEEVR